MVQVIKLAQMEGLIILQLILQKMEDTQEMNLNIVMLILHILEIKE